MAASVAANNRKHVRAAIPVVIGGTDGGVLRAGAHRTKCGASPEAAAGSGGVYWVQGFVSLVLIDLHILMLIFSNSALKISICGYRPINSNHHCLTPSRINEVYVIVSPEFLGSYCKDLFIFPSSGFQKDL